MQSNGESHIPIQEKDLAVHASRASQLINKVTFRPTRAAKATAVIGTNVTTLRESSTGAPQEDSQSLLVIAKTISNDALLLTDAANHVLSTIRKGITIGFYLAEKYAAASGLETLSQLNRMGRLAQAQHAEFQAKNATAAAVASFTLASYVVWELSAYKVEQVQLVKMPEVEAPEVYLINYINAIDCGLYYFCMHLKKGLVQTDTQMVKAAILYFEAVVHELKFKEKSFIHAEFFTGVSYRLADSEFRVKGFEDPSAASVTTNEFNKVDFHEIVGNRMAKHEAKRTAQRLVCYDPKAKKNPFMSIGGMPLVRLGYGYPGTGKSLQIAATATLIDEYCTQIGVPFIFHPMPQTIVSTFQGGSAERMAAWMQMAHGSNSVNYLPIDDAEDKFRNRTHEGVSAGVREVISIFLTETEGASAPRFGNTVIELFTNLPEQLDPAVLSRVTSRFSIDGATTWEDFLDQDHLWLKKMGDERSFLGMTDPKGYEYLANQKDVGSVGQLQAPTIEIGDPRLKEALAAADKSFNRMDHGFFAFLFNEVKKYYPMFTSRDVRNIQQAINVRITDFDLPDDWFEHPDKGFFASSFDQKVEMLKELRKACMKGLSFPEVRFQETIRYLSTLASIANVERERKIAALIESSGIHAEASARMSRSPKQLSV